MESFIYGELNRASRQKEKSKIQYYGAYAASLSYIIYSANKNRKNCKLKGVTTLYRGLKLTIEQINQYTPGSKMHLLGYTSTSKSFQSGLKFALKDLTDDKLPVIFIIKFKS